MKNSLTFSFGVSIFNVTAALIACFLFGREINSVETLFPFFVIDAVIAWIFFSAGAMIFAPEKSSARSLTVGMLCGLVQAVVARMAYPYIGSDHAMFAFFIMPIVVLSFLAPAISARSR